MPVDPLLVPTANDATTRMMQRMAGLEARIDTVQRASSTAWTPMTYLAGFSVYDAAPYAGITRSQSLVHITGSAQYTSPIQARMFTLPEEMWPPYAVSQHVTCDFQTALVVVFGTDDPTRQGGVYLWGTRSICWAKANGLEIIQMNFSYKVT